MIVFPQELYPDNVRAMPQKSNEWYTPELIIRAVYKVLGQIDLDPASCMQANRIVKATKFYTENEDGLSHSWHGKVWCNPPYSMSNAKRGMEPGRTQRSVIKLWISHLIREYRAGNVTEAILLTKTDMKAAWFQPLWEYLICFAHDHLYFYRPGALPEKHFYGTCFVYLGTNEQKFIDIFSKFGRIAKAIDTPKAQPVTLSLWESEREL